MIAVLGRKDLGTGILRNMTDGGEGCSGRVLSEETKKKLSDSHKGKKFTEEHKRKLSEAAKNRVMSDEWKANISSANIGKCIGENNHSWGKRWWNNGVKCKFSKECPGGDFSLGRLINKVQKKV